MSEPKPHYPKLGIVMIATNKYVDYWKQLVMSILDNTKELGNLELYLFTDQKDEMVAWGQRLDKAIKIEITEIPNFVWPDATLRRFEIINQHRSTFSNQYLFYLDVDMIINADLLKSLAPHLVDSGMIFVPHPGFVTGRSFAQKFNMIHRPRVFLSILKNCGSAGDWETNALSTAFVPKNERKVYLHGAFWGGERGSFFRMIETCARQVELDLDNKIIAKWHDESHLNKYFTQHGGKVLPSEFSWYEPYKNWLSNTWVIASVNTFGKTR